MHYEHSLCYLYCVIVGNPFSAAAHMATTTALHFYANEKNVPLDRRMKKCGATHVNYAGMAFKFRSAAAGLHNRNGIIFTSRWRIQGARVN